MNALTYGFVANDINFDNTVKLNEFINDTEVDLYFPEGTYYFNTKPNKIDRNINIKGAGVNNTTLVRNFQPVDLYESLIHANKTIMIEDLSIHAILAKNGGCAIIIESTAASSSKLSNLYITSPDGSTYGCSIYLNGLNTQLGIRTCILENIESFACTVHGLWLNNVKGLNMMGVQHYVAGGTASHITVQGDSANILMLTRYCPMIYFYTTQNAKIVSVGGTAIGGSNSTNIQVI